MTCIFNLFSLRTCFLLVLVPLPLNVCPSSEQILLSGSALQGSSCNQIIWILLICLVGQEIFAGQRWRESALMDVSWSHAFEPSINMFNSHCDFIPLLKIKSFPYVSVPCCFLSHDKKKLRAATKLKCIFYFCKLCG